MPGWVHVEKPGWRKTVIAMRIACPANFVFALTIGAQSVHFGNAMSAASDFFCAGITLVLGAINWFVYTPTPRGK